LALGKRLRLERALNFLLEIRVVNLRVSPGLVFAEVQGTAPTPYRVKLEISRFSEAKWLEIAKRMDEVRFLTAFYRNELPEDIQNPFSASKLALFPHDFKTDCSCPDTDPSCKHIAATVLFLARLINFNPLILFELRGKTRDDFFDLLELAQLKKQGKKFRSPPKIPYGHEITTPDIPCFDTIQTARLDFYGPSKVTEEIEFTLPEPTAENAVLENIQAPYLTTLPDEFTLALRDIYMFTCHYSHTLMTQALTDPDDEDGDEDADD
jgi:uncharacterized Zn finger protein